MLAISTSANGANRVDIQLPKWEHAVAPLKSEPLTRGKKRADWLQRIQAVSAEINKIPYIPEAPGVDVWQTPDDFAANGGDCEDSAIAKYYALREQGFAEKNMLVVVVRIKKTGELHALLFVWLKDVLYILDNFSPGFRPGGDSNLFEPIFGVNRVGVYLPDSRKSFR